MTKTADDVFNEYADRFDWEPSDMVDVLVAYLGESILDPLLSLIEEVGMTEGFEEFLEDNWGDDRTEPPNARDLIAHDQEPDAGSNDLIQELLGMGRSEPKSSEHGKWQREGF